MRVADAAVAALLVGSQAVAVIRGDTLRRSGSFLVTAMLMPFREPYMVFAFVGVTVV